MRSSHVIDILAIESGIIDVDAVPLLFLPGLPFCLACASKNFVLFRLRSLARSKQHRVLSGTQAQLRFF